MRSEQEIKIFAGSGSRAFAGDMCAYLGVPLGDSCVKTFSDGNIYVKLEEKVRRLDVYVVQTVGLDSNNEFMELLFWIDAFKRSGSGTVTAIIPYFGYAKGDKKDEPRVSIRGRVCADCLEAAGVDRIITMDLHSPQIQGFFKKPVDHLYASRLFIPHIKSLGLENFIMVGSDSGSAKNINYYADKLGVAQVIGNKQRVDHSETPQIAGFVGNVEEADAVIVDDFTTSCGTLVETAKALKSQGARDIYAYVTHCLLRETYLKALEESPIKKLYVTDTVYNPALAECGKVHVISAAGMFAKAVRTIHEGESLSILFD